MQNLGFPYTVCLSTYIMLNSSGVLWFDFVYFMASKSNKKGQRRHAGIKKEIKGNTSREASGIKEIEENGFLWSDLKIGYGVYDCTTLTIVDIASLSKPINLGLLKESIRL